jgi:phosphoserine phosphatase
MNADAQAPRWLRRADAPREFVATICCSGELDGALVPVHAELAELRAGAQRRLGANACQMEIDCTPAEAWSLWQRLRARLREADVQLRPRDEPGKRLLICDMDMTIVAAETLDEVAAKLGFGDEIAAITARAMHGDIDFNAALRERIAMLAGRPEQVFIDIVDELELNPGAQALVEGAKAAGVHTILISGGFAQVAEPVAARLGFDEVHCNRLEIEDGKLTGRVPEPIVNADFKCRTLQLRAQALDIELKRCCAIGDGANDLPMLSAAGLGIAYRAKPVLRDATACRIDHTGLDSALHFMGIDAS